MLCALDPSKQHVYARFDVFTRELASYCKFLLSSAAERETKLWRLEKASWEYLDVIEEQCSEWSKVIKEIVEENVSERTEYLWI